MEKLIRVLPYADADGPANMAADETLLHAAAAGIASLRFYGWLPPTASLGYFQSAAARDTEPLKSMPFVRRPTGGATLVHHHELTYALVLPAEYLGAESWLIRMHRVIVAALQELGVPCSMVAAEDRNAAAHVLCFRQFTPGDIVVRCRGDNLPACRRGSESKVVGSAQRKARQCLLQHGGILLEQSPYAPVLPGIRELTGILLPRQAVQEQIMKALAAETSWRFADSDWTAAEREQIEALAAAKYRGEKWNRKR